MKNDEIIRALKSLKAQTGSLVCLGCGHEHNCGVHGCAVLRETVGLLEKQEQQIQMLKWERDAAVKQLRKIADCGTCRKDRPEGVDGPECVACTRGQNWEWDGGKA